MYASFISSQQPYTILSWTWGWGKWSWRRLERLPKIIWYMLKAGFKTISNASGGGINVDIVVVVEDTHTHQCIWALAVMGFKFFLTESSLWRTDLNSLIMKTRGKGSQGARKYKIYVYWELKLKVDRFRWTCQQDIWLYNSYSSYEVKCCFCLFKRILAVFVFISHY